MAAKRPRKPRPEPAEPPATAQLVFPFDLHVGDVVIEDDGTRLEVVGRPTTRAGGKITHAIVRRPVGVTQETRWPAWHRLRVERRSA